MSCLLTLAKWYVGTVLVLLLIAETIWQFNHQEREEP